MYESDRSACIGMDEASSDFSAAKPVSKDPTLAEQLARIVADHGFQHFLMASFPRGDRPDLATNLVATSWSDALLSVFAEPGSFVNSRLIVRMRDKVVPICATSSIFAQEARAKTAVGAPEAAGLLPAQHVALAVHDADLNHYVFVFSGDGDVSSRARMGQLYLRCLELLDGWRADQRRREQPSEKLSSRELECLRWSAAGKSSEEIAIILNISAHTVVSYLKSAMRKLDSVNRMQAIARACRMRLI